MNDSIAIRDGGTALHEASRRELIRSGLLGGAVVAAAAIPFLSGAASAVAAAEGDAAVLRAAIALEQSAVLAYTSAVATGKLGDATGVAELFAKQEQEHADALIQALEGMGGGGPPARPRKPHQVPGLAKAAAGSASDILNFAVGLETMALGAYYAAHGKLETPDLLSTSASIMANEAQHLVILRQALKRNPSPDAFVTGRK